MTSVCLIVLGIAGQFCYAPAELIGECVEMNHSQYLCIAPHDALSIRLSAYDPSWCDVYPTNCYEGNTSLATGLHYADYYGIAAACPIEWLHKTVTVDGVLSRVCLDTGGAIEPTYRNGEWFIVIDVLYHFEDDPKHGESWPWWALQNYELWSVE